MTVKDLMEELEKCPAESEVVVYAGEKCGLLGEIVGLTQNIPAGFVIMEVANAQ